MSRAAVKYKKKLERKEREIQKVDAVYVKMETDAQIDACEVKCDNCGLEQVSPGPNCILCNCETGTFVRHLRTPLDKL